MSSGKSLSNGTLRLRFMQNAHRVKMQKEVELEQAKIKDEQEWEVSMEMKEAWGIGSSTGTQEDAVHEASYVPFLFSTDDSAPGPSKFRGRRTFNDNGQETLSQEKSETAEGNEEKASLGNEKPRRIISISGFKRPGAWTKDGKGARKKTAQMLIREDPLSALPPRSSTSASSDVASGGILRPTGVDPPAEPRSVNVKREPVGTEAVSSGFMRPVGVDAPATKTTPGSKMKRERDAEQVPGRGGGSTKRKKNSDVFTEIP